MRFDDLFPLVQDADLKPASAWGKPRTPPYIPQADECYGLPTGARNGVWVLDLDKKGDKNGILALHAHMTENDCEDLPETYTVRTRSGGLHLYFALPEDGTRIGNRVGVLPGVDVRGEGGFVRAGGPYEAVSDAPLAQAPQWLVGLCKSKAAGLGAGVSAIAIEPTHKDWDSRIAKAAEYLKRAEPCISGVNGQKMIWLVSLHLSRTLELPIATSLELLKGYNARCTPPWDMADWARTLSRAAEHGETIPGTFSEDFLAPLGAPGSAVKSVTVPAGPATDWSQRPNPDHTYSFDLSVEVSGGSGVAAIISQRDLTAAFTGPGASPEWVGVWQYDEFRYRVVAINPPLKLNAETTGLDSVDYANIQMYFAVGGFKVQIGMVEAAIKTASSVAAFHPVRRYLESLGQVDAKSADDYFTGIAGRLWGAPEERDALESANLRRFAIAAVRRIRRPGTKVDTMLVLTGPQGWNKSEFCTQLFGEYFRDQMPPLESKDASIALEGYWGIEMAEMTAFHRAGEAVKKEFLARREDKYRPPYEKGTIVRKRQAVFVGTTNEHEFLTDPTGARRYDVCEMQKAIDLGSVDRDAFWAAASTLEASGERHWRDVHAEDPNAKSVGGVQAAGFDSSNRHQVEDLWTDAILKYAAGKAQVSASECLTYGVLQPLDQQDSKSKARVSAILRRYFGPPTVLFVGGRTQHLFLPGRAQTEKVPADPGAQTEKVPADPGAPT